MSTSGTWYRYGGGTRTPGTWYQVPATKKVHTWDQVYQVNTWYCYQVPGTRYHADHVVPRSRKKERNAMVIILNDCNPACQVSNCACQEYHNFNNNTRGTWHRVLSSMTITSHKLDYGTRYRYTGMYWWSMSQMHLAVCQKNR